jgi:hypothetical protein
VALETGELWSDKGSANINDSHTCSTCSVSQANRYSVSAIFDSCWHPTHPKAAIIEIRL